METNQLITNYAVSASNPSLFQVQPAIGVDGTLTFTSAANANGSATITVIAQDDGGTANNGVDRTTNSFTITITPVNDAPSFTFVSNTIVVLEGAGAVTLANQVASTATGPVPEPPQLLTNYVVTTTNTALFTVQPALSVARTLTFTLAPDANGTAYLTVQAQDDGGTANGGTNGSALVPLILNITPVNDAPTVAFTTSLVTVLEDAGAQVVTSFASSLANDAGQSVTNYVVTAANPGLFDAVPAIALNGTLTFTPAANANGTTVVTVIAQDDGGTANNGVDRTTNSFTITITPVNDVPRIAFTTTTVVVVEDSGTATFPGFLTLTTGPANESGQTLTTSSLTVADASLFSVSPAVAADGTLTFTPAVETSGTTTVTIIAEDDGGTANGGIARATNTFTLVIQSGVAASYTWLGGTGNWHDRTQWSPAGVPSASDTVSIAAGTVQITNAVVVGGMTISGGTVTGIGALTVTTNLAMSAGTFAGTGALNLPAGATATLSSATTKTIARTVNNSGTVTWTGGTIVGNANAVFNNLAGGVFDIQTESTFFFPTDGTSGRTFNNAGIVRKTVGVGTTTWQGVFNNTGTNEVLAGTVKFQGGGQSSGAFQSATGAVLEWSNGDQVLSAGAALAGAGIRRISGGTLTVATGATVTAAGTTEVSGGTLAGEGTFTVPSGGAFNITTGSLTGAGKLSLATGSTMSIAGASSRTIARTIDNSGTVTWTGGTVIGNANAVFNNLAGGVFDIQTDSTFLFPTDGTSGRTFNNAGTVRKTVGAGTTAWQGAFNNTGTNEVRLGTVSFSDGGTSSGTFTNAPGATTAWIGGTQTLTTGAALTGEGGCRIAGGTLAVAAGATVPVSSPMELANGGTLAGAGNFAVQSGAVFTMSGGSATGTGALTILRGATLNLSSAVTKTLARTVNNSGTVNWTDGTVRGNANAVFNNLTGGLFFASSPATFFSTTDGTTGRTFNNAGSVFRSGAGTVSTWEGLFNNTGTNVVTAGTLTFTGGGLSSGHFRSDSGAVLEWTAGTHVLTNGVIVSGAGTQQVHSTATLTIASGTTLLADGNFTVANGTVNGEGFLDVPSGKTLNFTGGTIGGSGLLTIASGGAMNLGTGTTKFLNRSVSNSGTVTWTGSAVIGNANPSFTNHSSGVLDIQVNSTFYSTTDGTTGRTFYNLGTIRKTAGGGISSFQGTFNHTGRIELHTGQLNVPGNFNPGATGVLTVYLGGTTSITGYAKLVPLGTTTFGGTLNVVLTNGFTPASGDSFVVVDGSSGSGAFTTVNGQSLGGGLFLMTNYSGGDLTLQAQVLNTAPAATFAADPVTVVEDSGAFSQAGFASFTTGGAVEATQSITNVTTTALTPSLFAVQPAITTNGTLTFTPAANAFGSSTVRVVAQDNGGTGGGGVNSVTNSFVLTISGVNDAPVITFSTSNVQVVRDLGPQSVAGFMTTDPGNAFESAQTVTLISATAANPTLFSAQPAITAGTLTFTTATRLSGTSVITVITEDDGGTANGGVNRATNTFTITVTDAAPTNYVWNGTVGDWNDPTKWTPTGVPANADTAYIDAGTVTITNTTTVHVLHMGAGGTVTGSGDLVFPNGSTFNLTNGTVSGTGLLTVDAGATVNIRPAGITVAGLSRPLNNSGTINWSSGHIRNSSGASLTNQVSGSFIANGNTLFVTGSSTSSVFYNFGTFRKTSGTTTISDEGFKNHGTVDVQDGVFSVRGTSFSSGVWTNAGQIEFFSGSHAFTNSSVMRGAGLRTWSTPMSVAADSSLTIEQGTVTLGSSVAVTGQLLVSSGALFRMTGGTLVGPGSFTAAGGSTVELMSNTTKAIACTVTNAGLMKITAGVVTGTNNARIFNLAGGEFEVAVDGTLFNNSAGVGTALDFSNAGTVRKTAGTGTTTWQGTFDNTGTLEIQTGIVSLTNSYAPSAGSALTVFLGGTTAGTQFGQLKVSGTNLNTGTLNVVLTNSFTPVSGDSFKVVDGLSTGSGAFSATSGRVLGGGLFLATNYVSGDLTLVTSISNTPPVVTFATSLVTVLEDSGVLSQSGFASASVGGAAESGQSLTSYTVTAADTSLFSAGPAIALNGTLTFTPATNANGTTVVTVVAQDNGGTVEGGVDKSTNTFRITINAVNDAPTIALDLVRYNQATNSPGYVTGWGEYVVFPLAARGATFTNIAAGWQHNLAQKSDGTVIGWGDNSYSSTTVPASATNVVALAVGQNHDLAVRADGTVVEWGFINGPQPADLTNVTAVAAGQFHSLALRADGTVRVWGSGTAGTAGNIPAGLANVKAIAAGGRFNLVMLTNGTVVAWGDNGSGTNVPVGLANVVAIAAGGSHGLAVHSDGTITGWGDNSNGKITIPVAATSIVAVAAGSQHSVAVRSDGSVLAWGGNANGQTTIPAGLANVTAIRAYPFGDHTVALKGDGTIVAWGDNSQGQTTDPAGPGLVRQVAGGFRYAMALKTDGTPIAWGAGSSPATLTIPAAATNLTALAGGHYHAVGLRADGTVIAWGDSSFGKTDVPTSVTGVAAIASQGDHTLALLSNSTVVAWGRNHHSQTNVPAGLTNVTAIAAGDYHSLALRSDGTVVAWGSNDNGQSDVPAGLINVAAIACTDYGSFARRTDGTIVFWGNSGGNGITAVTNARHIAGRRYHALAIRQDETVFSTSTAAPTGLTRAVGISVVGDSSLALYRLDSPGVVVNEDAGAQSFANFATNLTAGAGDSGQTLTFTVTNDNNALFSSQPALDASGTLTFTPAANAFGTATVTVLLADDGGTANGGANSATAQTFNITINAVNDAPVITYTTTAVAVLEDSGAQTVSGFATGAAVEAGQRVTSYTVTAADTALFSAGPAIAVNGTLTFTPAANANGSTVVTVIAQDDGGTANGGVDKTTNTFNITITAVNDAPVITYTTTVVTVLEDSGAQTVSGFATGAAVEAGQSVTNYTISVADAALFSADPAIAVNGTLTFTPAANANGSTVVTVIAQDDGGTANGGVDKATNTFTITITAVNDAPVITYTTTVVTVLEDSGAQTASGFATGSAVEAGQSVTNYTVTAADTALFSAGPAIAVNGTLTFTPAANANGSTVVTVIAQDDGGTANGGVDKTTNTFTITITAVNDPPSYALPPVIAGTTWTARESSRNWYSVASSADGTRLVAVVNGGQIYTSTDSGVSWTARENNRSWKSVASSADGTKLVAVVYGGQIYTSTDSGVSWTARESNRDWISVCSSADGSKLAAVVNEGQIYTSTDSGVSWTARESNRTWNSVASSADGSKLVAVVFIGQIYTSTDSGVSWTARESDRDWYSVTSSADGSKLVAVNYEGQIYISTDSGVNWTARESSRRWVSVASSADGSKLVAVGNSTQIYTTSSATDTLTLIVNEDSGLVTSNSFATSISAGAGDSGQTLTFTLANDNNALFSSQPAMDASGTLTFTPAANAFGTATVTVLLADDGGTANGGANSAPAQTFNITVNSVNDAPTLTLSIASLGVSEDIGLTTFPALIQSFSPGPANESSQLRVGSYVVTNTHPSLFTVQPAVAADGTLTFTGAPDATGLITVTVQARDDGGTDDGGVETGVATFTLELQERNDAPTVSYSTSLVVALEDAGAVTVSNFVSTVTVGPSFEVGSQTITNYTLTAADTSLFASGPAMDTNGTLTFTAAANANGTTTVTVVGQDNGGTSNGGVDKFTNTFTIQLTAVNDAPSFAFATNSVRDGRLQISQSGGDEFGAARRIVVDEAGSYFVGGQVSFSATESTDVFLIKYTGGGLPLWTNRFEIAESRSLADMASDGLGGVVLTTTKLSEGSYNVVTMRFSPTGGILWSNIYNGGQDDEPNALAVDTSGNVIVVGYKTTSGIKDFLTLKYTLAGTPVWTNVTSSAVSGDDTAKAVAVDAAGDVYVAGDGADGVGTYGYALKLNGATGAASWTNQLGDTLLNLNGGFAAVGLTTDGNVVMGGYLQQAFRSYAVVRYTAAGGVVWSNVFDIGTQDKQVRAMAVSRNDVYIAGETFNGSDNDFAIVKFRADGTRAWTNLYAGAVAGDADEPVALVVNSGGDVFVAGHSTRSANKDIVTLKFTSDGVPVWTNRFDGFQMMNDEPFGLATGASGELYVAGSVAGLSASSSSTFWTLRYGLLPAGGADQVIDTQFGSAFSLAGFIGSSSVGPANESVQALEFSVTSSNPGLFSTQPSINAAGLLSFTAAGTAAGVAVVTVRAQDDGGTANGGTNQSAPQTFNITVSTGVVATAYTWVGGAGSGSWHNVTNWSPNGVPGPNDSAILSMGTVATTNAVTLKSLTLAGASLDGNHTISSSLVWSSGSLTGTNVLALAAGSTATVSGTGSLSYGGTLRNAGTLTVSSGGLAGGTTARLENLAGGVINYTITQTAPLTQAGGWLANHGTFNKLTSTSGSLIVGSFVTNTGTIHIDAGTMVLTNGGAFGGLLTNSSGQVLQLDASSYDLMDGLLVRGSGVLRFIAGGTYTVPTGATATISGGVQHLGGTIAGGGTLLVTSNSSYVWNGGEISGSGSLLVTNSGQLQINGSVTLGRSLQNYATVVWHSGTTVTANGNLTVNNEVGGTLDLRGDGTFLADGTAGTRAIVNRGTLVRRFNTGAATLSAPVTNFGLVDIQSGILTLTQPLISQASGQMSFTVSGLTPGTQHGRLVLPTGSSLDGTLALNTAGYATTPVVGDIIEILSHPSGVSGSFASAGSYNVGGVLFTLESLADRSRYVGTSIIGPAAVIAPGTGSGSERQIRWPASAGANWTLESAPTVLGPWTPVVVPTVVENGERIVHLPTTGTRFYRLVPIAPRPEGPVPQ